MDRVSYLDALAEAKAEMDRWTRANVAKAAARRKPRPARTHCRNGHELAVAGVYPNGRAGGRCRICQRDNHHRWYASRHQNKQAVA